MLTGARTELFANIICYINRSCEVQVSGGSSCFTTLLLLKKVQVINGKTFYIIMCSFAVRLVKPREYWTKGFATVNPVFSSLPGRVEQIKPLLAGKLLSNLSSLRSWAFYPGYHNAKRVARFSAKGIMSSGGCLLSHCTKLWDFVTFVFKKLMLLCFQYFNKKEISLTASVLISKNLL